MRLHGLDRRPADNPILLPGFDLPGIALPQGQRLDKVAGNCFDPISVIRIVGVIAYLLSADNSLLREVKP